MPTIPLAEQPDDALVTQPVIHRTVSVAQTGVQKPAGAIASVFDLGTQATIPVLSLAGGVPHPAERITVRYDMPVPPITGRQRGKHGSMPAKTSAQQWLELLLSMRPGGSFECTPKECLYVQQIAIENGIKVTTRTTSPTTRQIWKV